MFVPRYGRQNYGPVKRMREAQRQRRHLALIWFAIALLYMLILFSAAARAQTLGDVLQEYQWQQQLIERQRDDDNRRWWLEQESWRALNRDYDAWQRQNLRHRDY